MTRHVVFNALWLLSERDTNARFLKFGPEKNLLAGHNDTGKSRVIKHLVWALGCEPPRRAAGNFDSNVVAALYLTVGARKLILLRQNKCQAAFDEFGGLIFATQNGLEWSTFFAEAFDFPLQLLRPDETKFDFAGPGSALLPSYIDQDSGWGTKWSAFTNLGQFIRWQPALFNSYTGLKSAAWMRSHHRGEQASIRLKTAKSHAKLQESSYQRVVAMLPSESTAIDEKQFAQELRALSEQAQNLRAEQDSVRANLLALAISRQKITAEFNMALASERELVEDQAFLAGYKDDEQLICPTCSHVHTTSFLARQVLAQDSHDIHEVVIGLQAKLQKLDVQEAELQANLKTVVIQLRSLTDTLNIKRDGQPLADVVAAKSLFTLQQAYDLTRRDLAAEIDSLTTEKKTVDEELAALTDKGREKRIREYFSEELESFADKLGINKIEMTSKVKIGARSPSASGSNAPRAVLAMHLALLSTHEKYGEGPSFPFIVDTPQQSGQDPNSLARMLTTILTDSAVQAIVATESIPPDWVPPSGCHVLQFDETRKILRKDEFKRGVEALAPLVVAMMEALKAAPSQPEEEHSSEQGHVDDEDEDDGKY